MLSHLLLLMHALLMYCKCEIRCELIFSYINFIITCTLTVHVFTMQIIVHCVSAHAF